MRAVYMPSDPGVAYSIPEFGASSSSGGGSAVTAAEVRRVSTSNGTSFRRTSRNTSSRLNADQDWAIMGPDGQLLPQQMPGSGGGATQGNSGWGALHVPGPTSRRTSRTLSGAPGLPAAC